MSFSTRPDTQTEAKSAYLRAVAERIIVFDGAMGTSVQALDPSPEDFGGRPLEGCNEALVLHRPEIIASIHESFLEAGADVIETDTFGGSRLKLVEYGLGDLTYRQNFEAARLARRVADRFSTPERPRFVAGSMGPTGKLPSSDDPSLSDITFGELATIYAEQAKALVDGGVDLLLIETSQDMLEVRAAVIGIQRLFAETKQPVPLQVQVTLDTSGRMLLGTEIGAVLTTLEALGVDVVGLNCSTGPEHMRESARFLVENGSLPVSIVPNAGLPQNVGGRAVYPMKPDPFVRQLESFVRELGVGIVGGCCGTTPEHIRLLSEAVRDVKPRPIEKIARPAIAGAIQASSLIQEPAPLLIGERVNAQGSRKAKRLLLDDNIDGLVSIAREQLNGGAHALDLCVALTERSDEADQLARLVKKLSQSVEGPLVLDSTEPEAIRRGLEVYPGRALINSTNLEDGGKKARTLLGLAREHGAAIIVLTIDEEGMGKTSQRKLEIARRIHQMATEEYGLSPDSLLFDALTFTLGTGDPDLADSALQTLDGIRLIKSELPGVLTVLGVSNVSFGLERRTRAALNSVFLYHAVQAGLDAAIINPADVTPYAEIPPEMRELCDDLILNRRPDALARLIESDQNSLPDSAKQRNTSEEEALTFPIEERISRAILERRKEGIESLIDAALGEREPVLVLNEILLPAMKEVGDRFGRGELILPFVLQSAEVMKRAVAHLEQYFERQEGYTKGRIVLATVFGDVHDIGKNLVGTILGNNGYTVYDLGKQTPLNVIIEKAIDLKADAIGLSALLVSTSKQMPLCVAELARRGIKLPVLIGGAAINRHFGRRTALLEDGSPYEGGLFYCRDAFEGLDVMDKLSNSETRDGALERAISDAVRAGVQASSAAPKEETVSTSDDSVRSKVSVKVAVPTPPFWGRRTLTDIPLEEVFAHLDLNTLYRLHWGGRGSGEAWQRLIDGDFGPRLEKMRKEAGQFLSPKVVYGYFPAQSRGNSLLIFSEDTTPANLDRRQPIAEMAFPRQPAWDRLCLADYFRPVESGELDVVAFQVVTVGQGADDAIERLQARSDYSEAYFVHGLGVQTAEALAEWTHARVRRELGLADGQGRRYSWGYPACPDLSQHEAVFSLLGVADEIGVTLTSAYQLVPEQSTAALVAHHPEAIYYTTRAPGGD